MYIVVDFLVSVDATDSDGIARFANDDLAGNSRMKMVECDGERYPCLFATRDLAVGVEVVYNYSMDKKSTDELFWRKVRLLHDCRLAPYQLPVCISMDHRPPPCGRPVWTIHFSFIIHQCLKSEYKVLVNACFLGCGVIFVFTFFFKFLYVPFRSLHSTL